MLSCLLISQTTVAAIGQNADRMTSWRSRRLETTHLLRLFSLCPPLSSLPSVSETHFNTRPQELSTLTVLVWSQSLWPQLVELTCAVSATFNPHGSLYQSHRKSKSPSQYQLIYGLTVFSLFCFSLSVIPSRRWKRLLSSPFVPIYILCFIIYLCYYFKCLVWAFF